MGKGTCNSALCLTTVKSLATASRVVTVTAEQMLNIFLVPVFPSLSWRTRSPRQASKCRDTQNQLRTLSCSVSGITFLAGSSYWESRAHRPTQ